MPLDLNGGCIGNIDDEIVLDDLEMRLIKYYFGQFRHLF